MSSHRRKYARRCLTLADTPTLPERQCWTAEPVVMPTTNVWIPSSTCSTPGCPMTLCKQINGRKVCWWCALMRIGCAVDLDERSDLHHDAGGQ